MLPRKPVIIMTPKLGTAMGPISKRKGYNGVSSYSAERHEQVIECMGVRRDAVAAKDVQTG